MKNKNFIAASTPKFDSDHQFNLPRGPNQQPEQQTRYVQKPSSVADMLINNPLIPSNNQFINDVSSSNTLFFFIKYEFKFISENMGF